MPKILTAIALFLGAISFTATSLFLFIHEGSFWGGLATGVLALLLIGALGTQADKDRALALAAQQLKDNPDAPVDIVTALVREATRSGDVPRPPKR